MSTGTALTRGIAGLNDVARAPRGEERAASRLLSADASVAASSVLVDSAMEHYRGSFRNPAMVLPIALSAGSLLLNGRETVAPAGPPLPAPPSFSGLAVAGIAALRLLKDMRRG